MAIADDVGDLLLRAAPAPRCHAPSSAAGVSPDDHLATLRWAFDEFTAGDASRRQTIRYYAALLDMEAGRPAKARQDLTALRAELASSPGRLLDAVKAALARKP